MLLAVMDLGSNSFKMTVAQWAPELSRAKPFRALHKERHPIQLGASVFSAGSISEEDLKKAIQALRRMQARLHDFASPILRVVATSAIRDAKNGTVFVNRVRKELGLNIEVITGQQEATLIARGLNIEYPKVGRGLLIDIGGGSTEIAEFGTGVTDKPYCKSFRVGSVRVASRFFSKPKTPDLAGARRHLRDVFKNLPTGKVECLVGSAGTIQSLAEIFAAEHSGPQRPISRKALGLWIEQNYKCTPKQLEKRYGLRPSRARVIVPGALVLFEALTALGHESIRVTGLTLRDGLMVDLVENWLKPRVHVLPLNIEGQLQRGSGISRSLLLELETVASRFSVNPATARHVAYLANTFCVQLARNLGSAPAAAGFRCLTAAAFFQYSGQVVSLEHFEKHSSYIVENIQFKHLSDREKKAVARIILFSKGKLPPNTKGVGLWGFNALDTKRIFQLTALFRLAVALDEIETQNILSAELKISGKRALIKLVQRGPGSNVYIQAIHDEFRYFEKVFGFKIVTFVDHQPAV